MAFSPLSASTTACPSPVSIFRDAHPEEFRVVHNHNFCHTNTPSNFKMPRSRARFIPEDVPDCPSNGWSFYRQRYRAAQCVRRCRRSLPRKAAARPRPRWCAQRRYCARANIKRLREARRGEHIGPARHAHDQPAAVGAGLHHLLEQYRDAGVSRTWVRRPRSRLSPEAPRAANRRSSRPDRTTHTDAGAEAEGHQHILRILADFDFPQSDGMAVFHGRLSRLFRKGFQRGWIGYEPEIGLCFASAPQQSGM